MDPFVPSLTETFHQGDRVLSPWTGAIGFVTVIVDDRVYATFPPTNTDSGDQDRMVDVTFLRPAPLPLTRLGDTQSGNRFLWWDVSRAEVRDLLVTDFERGNLVWTVDLEDGSLVSFYVDDMIDLHP